MTDVEVIPARDDGSLDGPRAWCHVMYGLHALSAIFGILTSAWIVTAFLFSWPSIISVIINYLTRDKVAGTWDRAKMNKPEDVAEVIWKAWTSPRDTNVDDLDVPGTDGRSS